jgi:Coenzyme PQQ synthesis protein D (PqqD)
LVDVSSLQQTDARYRVPDHIVHRSFPAETVVLNLQTGRYHGLNPTAGRMLETLGQCGSLDEAATVLAAEYSQPVDTVRSDLAAFCSDLIERGLIERA